MHANLQASMACMGRRDDVIKAWALPSKRCVALFIITVPSERLRVRDIPDEASNHDRPLDRHDYWKVNIKIGRKTSARYQLNDTDWSNIQPSNSSHFDCQVTHSCHSETAV